MSGKPEDVLETTPTTEKPKKSQPSRKGKKAWRKNVDVEELESGLESLRSEERVRGTIDDLPEEEHFTIDLGGDEKVKDMIRSTSKPLRVDQILAQRSAVPALGGRHVHNLSEPVYGELSKHQEKKVNQLAKRKLKEAPKPKTKKKAKVSYDMWNDEEETDKITMDNNDYLEPTKPSKVKAPVTMARIPKVMQHKPAVTVPHAGASYNPTEEDHKALLKKAADVEIAKYKEEKKLDQILSYRKELEELPHELQHLEDGNEEEEDKTSDTEEDIVENKKKKKVERKTTSQRHKEARTKAAQRVYDLKQQEKKVRQEIERLEITQKELEERTKLIDKLAKNRVETKERKEREGMNRIGQFHVQDMSMEVQLEDELSETLRQLKPEGSIFKDRFVSLQQRNIIEPRSPFKTPKRKYALKVYERRSYKTFDATERKKAQYKQIMQKKK
ncbi:ribosome biogenesis protein Nop53/GLTSCR2 [Halteromyces radiatus]|uniref:ribosome biogenesis protein Nop53/GLTSCR2 n=1 Tax=Halteromyces radiatus TaxID=101107 RepID=UPI0022212187|nr:ribosome biogenesis protein Nop53/GLTSCR2 [Halteromyces radiatus]KAI8088689.1 ribosome biogenesis protein Nop53/GLTSCR2 [Halteromyces radiatus]